MREKGPLEGKSDGGAEVIVSDFRRELKNMTDTGLLDLLDALRVAERKPEDAKSRDAKLIIAEARRRAYLFNEAADAVEKIIAKEAGENKQAA